MRLARFDEGKIGLVRDGMIADVSRICGVDPAEWPATGMCRVIAGFADLAPKLAGVDWAAAKPISSVRLLSPIAWPSKVIAYPVNYHAHGKEMSAQYRADVQGFFLKPNSSLSGVSDGIVLPDVPGREIHHECELGIIIGKRVRHIARDNAFDAIFGYSCLLDMVIRGREERVMRKAYDTFCPLGPWIVTADEVGDPSALNLKLWVDNELRQSANTRDLVLDIPGMVEMAAAVMTLEPGDVIATGTPEGVGPVKGGDTIRIAIERVGEMEVRVVQGKGGRTIAFEKPYVPNIVKG